jgi:hypothetical protein
MEGGKQTTQLSRTLPQTPCPEQLRACPKRLFASETADHEINHGDLNHGLTGLRVQFIQSFGDIPFGALHRRQPTDVLAHRNNRSLIEGAFFLNSETAE